MTDQSAIAATQSVLDKLVAGVSDRKAAKATRLTPTVSEAKLAPALPTASFPYDNPETMIRALNTVLVELEHVRKGVVIILTNLGGEPVAEITAVDAKKVAERAADVAAALRAEAKAYESEIGNEQHEFAVGYAAQQVEAQAATFGGKASIMRGLDINDQRLADAKAARIAAMKAELEELNR